MSSKKRKVAFIGPVSPPYRGGIAQYTSNMASALRQYVDLRVYSFKVQYPNFLYPGESDKDSNRIDKNTIYSLNIYSPMSWRRTALDIIEHGYGTVVISWWTFVWAIPFIYISKYLKKHGVKIVFLTHNLYDHDSSGWNKRLSMTALKLADSYIVHTLEQKTHLSGLDKSKPILQRSIPVFNHFPTPRKEKYQRGRLELLYFGFIRAYKGVDILIEAVKLLNDRDVYLTIVGEAWGKEKTAIVDSTKELKDNVYLYLDYMDDVDAANYFNNSDVVVLPYRSATGSAVVTLAYNYGKPVIATSVGGLPDVIIDGKTGWLVEPESPEELADKIRSISRSDTLRMKRSIDIFCRDNNWDAMATSIADFIETL